MTHPDKVDGFTYQLSDCDLVIQREDDSISVSGPEILGEFGAEAVAAARHQAKQTGETLFEILLSEVPIMREKKNKPPA